MEVGIPIKNRIERRLWAGGIQSRSSMGVGPGHGGQIAHVTRVYGGLLWGELRRTWTFAVEDHDTGGYQSFCSILVIKKKQLVKHLPRKITFR